MPYIITTTKPGHAVPVGADASYWVADTATRTAVATLEEARETAHQVAGASGTWVRVRDAVQAAKALAAEGGTVGPLPDGTVIEVRPVDWHDLIAANGGLCGHPITATDDATLAEVLEVYNAR